MCPELITDDTPATLKDWRDAVAGALQGRPFSVLEHASEDGDIFAPLAEAARNAPHLRARPANTSWQVVHKAFCSGPENANERLLAALAGGAAGIDLVRSDHPVYGGRGLPRLNGELLEQVLAGIDIASVPIRVSGGAAHTDDLEALFGHFARSSVDPAACTIAGSLDPAAICFAAGVPGEIEASARSLAALAAGRCADFPGSRPVLGDGRIWHAFGASAAQELALVLASLLGHLRSCEAVGLDPAASCRLFECALAADTDQLESIAKFRALRLLTAQVVAEIGAAGIPIPVHGETAWRMMSLYDQNVNILRATVAVFAAAVGGADSIAVLPHSLVSGVPDGFAQRLARNTQLVLSEEANLHRVADPAAGSGAIEQRTAALGERAWSLFQSIEGEGGLARAAASGRVAGMLAEAGAARARRIALRQDRLTGVTGFPAPRPDVPDIEESAEAPAFAGGNPAKPRPARLAEPFERLRVAAEARGRGGAPDIFLAGFGRQAAFGPRADWARSFFQVAGLAAETSEGSLDARTLGGAFAESGATVACLCAADEDYAAMAEAAVAALKGAGARAIYLAGRKDAIAGGGAWADELIAIHEGVDALAVLQDAHERLKIAAHRN